MTFNQVVGGSNPPCLSKNTEKSRVTGISNEYGTQKSTQGTRKHCIINKKRKERSCNCCDVDLDERETPYSV